MSEKGPHLLHGRNNPCGAEPACLAWCVLDFIWPFSDGETEVVNDFLHMN